MTLTRFEIAFGAIVLIVLVVLAFEYMAAHDERIHMEATIQAQKTVIDKAEADRQQHAKEDAARDAATAVQLDAMARAVAQIRTPQQIVGWSQGQLEQAIKGIQITVPAPTPENPHPSASVTIPEASLPGLRDTIEKCKECDVKLATAQADLASRAEQQQLADLQIKALQNERDTAVRAAKGGTWLQRSGKAVKLLVIGGAVGYIAARH